VIGAESEALDPPKTSIEENVVLYLQFVNEKSGADYVPVLPVLYVKNIILPCLQILGGQYNQCCGSGAFLPQGSGSGMIFFQIPDPCHAPNSIYLQDFTFKNGEKQEKFCLKYDFNYDLFLHEKGKFIFPSLICRIRI
jgi:hypothetical protein